MAHAQLPEQHEQVHLADAQLDVLSSGSGLPAEQPRHRGGRSSPGIFGPHTGAIDPAAQIRGDRDVRAGGHDPFGKWSAPSGEIDQRVAEDLLGRDVSRNAIQHRVRHVRRPHRQGGRWWAGSVRIQPGRRFATQFALGRLGPKTCPVVIRWHVELAAQDPDLLL